MEPDTIKEMTQAHKNAPDLFDNTSRKSKDRHTHGFSQSGLPALRHPLEMAQRMIEKSSAALEIS